MVVRSWQYVPKLTSTPLFGSTPRRRMTFYSDAGTDDQLVSSYTATSDSIRDSTAQLAGMAIRSDDERDDSRILEAEEEEEEQEGGRGRVGNESMAHGSWPVPHSSSPFARSYGTTGPSNLAKALSASRPTSPTGPSSASTPASGTADKASEHLTEQSALLGQNRRNSRSTRKPRQDSVCSSDALDSGFSVSSQQMRDAVSDGRRRGVRSAYGSGALAQASLEAEAEAAHGRGGVDESHLSSSYAATASGRGRDDDDDDNDSFDGATDEESATSSPEPLSPFWNLIPARWRPGRGYRPITPWIKSNADGSSMPLHTRVRKLSRRDVLEACAEPVRLLPATVLGILMNVLDGVSYGLIIFPASYPIFADFGGDGVAMFFISCIVSQLVFSLGGSIFKGGNGSMMIEVSGQVNELTEHTPKLTHSSCLVTLAGRSLLPHPLHHHH